MIRETVTPVVLATLVVLAGCAGGITPAPSGSGDANTGTVNFYISDERNAIDEFEHLNVTISQVGFKKADVDDEEDDEDNETTSTTTASPTTTTNNTTTSTTTTTDTTTTETTTVETEDTTTGDAPETTGDDDAEEDEEEEEAEDDEKEDSEGWVTKQVDNVTIDLTEYQGENATLLSEFQIPNGTYTKTFVYVSSVNGTLNSGEQVNVKLPSQKLHINKDFTIGNGESVDFVFDITVFKAGNSGMYILKPVVSQSGTDVPIKTPDEDDEDDEDENNGQGPPDDVGDNGDADEAPNAALNASFVGNVTPGENATITVTQNGTAVEGAQVFVDDSRVGKTDDNGMLTVMVPDDTEEFEVTVRYQDGEAEIEIEFEDESDDDQTTTATAT